MFSLAERSIFLTLAGSHAHGTARDGSDIDLRGICVAPLSVRLSLFDGFEQHEGTLPPELAPTSGYAITRSTTSSSRGSLAAP